MASTKVIRVDRILDGGAVGDTALPVYIGDGGGDTHAESVAEAIEGLTWDNGWNAGQTTQDVTAKVTALLEGREVKHRYAPEGEVRYVEVITRKVVAVYRGTLRPAK